MARRSRTRFVRPPKKTVMWIGDFPRTAPLTVPAGTASLDSVLSTGALLLRPFTVMRSRGILVVKSDQAAVSEEWNGAYGELVVTDSAAAAGAASIPSPITEPSASWLMYIPFGGSFGFLDSTGFQGGASSVFAYDSKAMRIVGPDDDLVGVVENGSGTTGITIQLIGRQLVQLH